MTDINDLTIPMRMGLSWVPTSDSGWKDGELIGRLQFFMHRDRPAMKLDMNRRVLDLGSEFSTGVYDNMLYNLEYNSVGGLSVYSLNSGMLMDDSGEFYEFS